MQNAVLDYRVTQAAGDVPVVILQAKGRLDYSTYHDLIAAVQKIYQTGAPNLLLDLQAVPEVGLAGLFALYSAALIFQGEIPLDPEGGYTSLNLMANRIHQTHLRHFRLLKPPARVEKALAPSGLPIYNDLSAALASFEPNI